MEKTFKVGDRVICDQNGRGTILSVTPTNPVRLNTLYKVYFDDLKDWHYRDSTDDLILITPLEELL
jgi:hypothetical protein